MAGMPKTFLLDCFLLVVVALAATSTPSAAAATTLTLHNLCPYPVWPLVTPNTGFPAISDNTGRLDGGGRGLVSFRFPDSFWAGRVVARTACSSSSSGSGPSSRCETGSAPPATVVQLVVHAAEGQDLAAYSVSLVDGFNVPAVVSPQAVAGGGQCPALGCAADLNAGCPPSQRVVGPGGGGAAVVACKGPAGYFKARCPLTRTTASDVEPVPQRCLAPGELKIVFCQSAMVNANAADTEPGRIRTVVVADN